MAVTEQVSSRRADIESWLDERRVAWEFIESLPIDDIDRLASLGNQARLEPLSEEVVDRYTADMERGDLFPPVVCRRKGKRLVLVGGNHRAAAAARANIAALPAYVITVEPEMAVRLTYEDNRRHGFPPSEEERLYQAVHLVNNGYSQSEAAEVTGVSPQKVSRALGVSQADQRATTVNVRGWERLAKSTRWRLGSIRSDPVFEAAAQLAADTTMNTNDAYELATKLNSARSEADALAIVGMESERRTSQAQASAGGLIRKATPRSKLMGALTVITALDPGDVAASCASSDQRDSLTRQITSAVRGLQAMAKAL